ncbi:MAG: L-serine ammonia-lyase, iron-sulfur-dependent, subunit alpha [Treponema sp.]
MSFESLASLVESCSREKKEFWQIVCETDMKESCMTAEQEFTKMRGMWNAMLAAADSYDKNLESSSGLSGGDGGRFAAYIAGGSPLCGDFTGKVIACALQMAESNACMKRIVAAPTAGSCGVLPAVLVPLYRDKKTTENKIIQGLFVSAGIGQIIANRASISGAEGGCQAEIGAASAMAAGTLVFLHKGTAGQIMYAAGFALQNLLGLVCDPVAGLVEVPCIKRNVVGTVNALSCADMALAGIVPKIPADEVIDAMKQVGNCMNTSLKETGYGGLAATQTGKQIAGRLYAAGQPTITVSKTGH